MTIPDPNVITRMDQYHAHNLRIMRQAAVPAVLLSDDALLSRLTERLAEAQMMSWLEQDLLVLLGNDRRDEWAPTSGIEASELLLRVWIDLSEMRRRSSLDDARARIVGDTITEIKDAQIGRTPGALAAAGRLPGEGTP